MKKSILSALIIFVISGSLGAQTIFKTPLSPRNANYNMQVTLDDKEKQIQGNVIVQWRNITQRPTQELQFHLYMNAFKNTHSTHLRENGGYAGELSKKRAWGWIDVHAIKLKGGMDLGHQMAFIHPDDDNEDDQTVCRVRLPRPVMPGQTIQIEIDFTTQLPWVYRRNGYYKNFFFAAQWFPKIGVLENGVWNCHQYHLNTEFYSDYGVYDVAITLPQQYIVGATGLLQETLETDSLKTMRFHAEDVHDFAWTAWPEYQIAKETHNGVEIKLMYDKDHVSSVKRTIVAMQNALDFMADWVEPYPYPNVTVIHPPTNCMNVAGMEYPTFITGGAFWPNPKGFRATEMVTIHEFTHNFWYGMVGNNEFEEAWLDEGINSYTEARIMDTCYGSETSMIDLLGVRFGELAIQRAPYIDRPRWDRTLRDAWTYIGGGYGTFSYNKPSLMLETLENLVGRETMARIMKTYFKRWKFKHPKSQDFIDIVNEISEDNYNSFFDQLLRGSGDLDYAIRSARTQKVKDPQGVFEKDGEKMTLPEQDKEKDTESDSTEVLANAEAESIGTTSDSTETEEPIFYKSVIRVQRKGEVILPVEVLMVFDNGDSLHQVWNGRDRWMRYEFIKPAKLIHAQVDPERKLVLDKDFANNSRTVEPRRKPIQSISSKLLYMFETALHLIGFFG